MQVRACGRDEIVLCGKAQKPFRVRFVEGGIITFKPVKAVRHQPRDKKFQLVFRDIHGVRDNRNAAVFFDEFHAVHRAESVARNVRFFAGAQILIKGVGHRFCKPLFYHFFGDVDAAEICVFKVERAVVERHVKGVQFIDGLIYSLTS